MRRRTLEYTSGSRTLPPSGPDGNRLHPPLHVNLTAGLEPIEAQPNQTSLLAYATDDRIAHHELDIEVAREPLQAACDVEGVTDHDIVQALRIPDASQDGFSVVHTDADVHGHQAACHPLPAPAMRL